MRTLISLQEQALAQMQEGRASERRMHRHQVRVLKYYRSQAAALGYTQEQINQQVRDIWDMFKLQQNAED